MSAAGAPRQAVATAHKTQKRHAQLVISIRASNVATRAQHCKIVQPAPSILQDVHGTTIAIRACLLCRIQTLLVVLLIAKVLTERSSPILAKVLAVLAQAPSMTKEGC